MLKPMTEGDWHTCRERAWNLACSLQTSGFPTYLDGVKTRGYFERRVARAFADDTETLLMLTDDQGGFRGLIQYVCLREERYVQTFHFLTEEGWQEAALEQFVAYAREHNSGMQLDMGFPAENAGALTYFARHGLAPMEEASVWMAHADTWTPGAVPPQVRPLDAENLGAFHRLHDAQDMYWTTERILGTREQWQVLLYGTEAVLYAMTREPLAEIYGVDDAEGFSAERFAGLVSELINRLAEAGPAHLCYFSENCQEEALLPALGFQYVCRYSCYSMRL